MEYTHRILLIKPCLEEEEEEEEKEKEEDWTVKTGANVSRQV